MSSKGGEEMKWDGGERLRWDVIVTNDHTSILC